MLKILDISWLLLKGIGILIGVIIGFILFAIIAFLIGAIMIGIGVVPTAIILGIVLIVGLFYVLKRSKK